MEATVHTSSYKFVHFNIDAVEASGYDATAEAGSPPLCACAEVEQPQCPVTVSCQEAAVRRFTMGVAERHRPALLQDIFSGIPLLQRVAGKLESVLMRLSQVQHARSWPV